MILATLRMTVQPEKRRDLLEMIRGILEPTRVERGCISYRLYEDIENKNVFALVGEWKTQEDLENHIRTENYRRLLTLMDSLNEPPDLQFHTISHTEGIDLIKSVLLRSTNSAKGL
jgi:quinol monooxygenase YgiN